MNDPNAPNKAAVGAALAKKISYVTFRGLNLYQFTLLVEALGKHDIVISDDCVEVGEVEK